MSPEYEALLERARAQLARRMLAAALLVQAEAKRDYSRGTNPAPHLNPAPPGTFPRARTFNLRDGIAINPSSPADIANAGYRVRVGYLQGAFYGAVLARKGWLGIRDTLARCRPALAKILGV